jgi:hypothetical protein
MEMKWHLISTLAFALGLVTGIATASSPAAERDEFATSVVAPDK